MSWSIGFDTKWKRDIGYGVPAFCDHPDCNETIDRGLAHVCGGEPYGGDNGCGLYFCSRHLLLGHFMPQQCERCDTGADSPFPPKPDHPDWNKHKLTDASWKEWRETNPEEAAKL